MSKKVLTSYQLVTDGALSTDFESDSLHIQFLDNIAIQGSFEGDAEGTFGVEVSIDNETWSTYTLASPPEATGVDGSFLLNLPEVSAPYIRLTFASDAGDSTLQAWVSGKEI